MHAGIHTHLLGRHTPGQTPPADTPLLGRYPLGRHPSERHPLPLGRPPPGKHPLGRHPPPGGHPPRTATAAGGTHPTGMHSCWHLQKYKNKKYIVFQSTWDIFISLHCVNLKIRIMKRTRLICPHSLRSHRGQHPVSLHKHTSINTAHIFTTKNGSFFKL